MYADFNTARKNEYVKNKIKSTYSGTWDTFSGETRGMIIEAFKHEFTELENSAQEDYVYRANIQRYWETTSMLVLMDRALRELGLLNLIKRKVATALKDVYAKFI